MPHVPERFLRDLVERRRNHHLPSQVGPKVAEFIEQILGLLFPHFARVVDPREAAVQDDIHRTREALTRLLRAFAAPDVADAFFLALPDVLTQLDEDANAMFLGDPAAESLDEVVLTYPGFYALALYRVAHVLHGLRVPTVPRLLTEAAHARTGIDIHPGASIGRRFCIDHGTGVVIGETTHIGDDVKLYQGVTLGALTVQKDLAGRKRHPVIEDGVVIYAGATILGGTTVVGRGSIIAGNAFLTRSVPPGSAVGRSGEVRSLEGLAADVLDFSI
jgi:serine O-acetyltransferase